MAAAAVSPIISPLLSRAAKSKLTNWAGNLEYSTDRLHPAHSLEQIASYVRKEKKLKRRKIFQVKEERKTIQGVGNTPLLQQYCG
jgi:hypothetical protein